MPRIDKRALLLDFFREKEREGSSFTFQEAADKTGYSPKSVNKYISEKLKGSYIFKSETNEWISEGLSQLPNDDFIRLMSQSTTSKVLTPNQKIYTRTSQYYTTKRGTATEHYRNYRRWEHFRKKTQMEKEIMLLTE